ncbi:hypothetical protein NFI96_008633 [Prochilodus magdalenae]|nr:hypothetical protein NFI96_008633 [Prochilodus magdalenae]
MCRRGGAVPAFRTLYPSFSSLFTPVRLCEEITVDMFSYGMVLYELLSGRRPALGHHQLQIAKKLSKGVRPVLGNPEEVQFHCLQTLMQECWDTKPEKRPLALPLLRQMQDPTFPCLRYLLPCQQHSQLFLSPLQGYSAVFWDGDKDDSTAEGGLQYPVGPPLTWAQDEIWLGMKAYRNYTVVNVAKGQAEVKRMPCPGTRLSCQLKMDTTLWTATEEQEIFIYSLKEMCPLSHPQKLLSCPAVVTCLTLLPARTETLPLIFAGMADGLMAVYTLVDDMPVEGEAYVCSHTLNKSLFGLEDSDPRQRPYPIRAIVPVRSGSEVWYTNGPGVLVIDSHSLQPVRRLDPYLPPSCVISMASSSSFRGDEAVWCLDDHTNTLLMYHAASYELCASYNCGDLHPLRDVFQIQIPSRVVIEGSLGADLPPEEEEPVPPDPEALTVTVIHSKEAGTQILRQQDSLDYCSISSSGFSSEQLDQLALSHIDASSSGALSSLASSSSMPFSTDCEDADKAQDEEVSSEPSPTASAEPAPQTRTLPYLQALTVVPVSGTIWVPRRGGDTMVIEVQEHSGVLRGRVIAVLTVPGVQQYGRLSSVSPNVRGYMTSY